MAYDEEEDLFDQEFDFVDDDDSDLEDGETADANDDSSDIEPEPEVEPKKRPPRKKRGGSKSKSENRNSKRKPKPAASEDESESSEESSEEEEKPAKDPGPPADHVVFVYEHGDYKRTIQREFTDEDAIKFSEEYNRTAKAHGRRAVPAERDEEPEPHL